jgi:hypothetical protein
MGMLSDVQASLEATPHTKDAAVAGRTTTRDLLLFFHATENPRLHSARQSCCVNPRFRTLRYLVYSFALREIRRHRSLRTYARTRLDIRSRHVQTAAAQLPPAPRVLARYSYPVGVGQPMVRA